MNRKAYTVFLCALLASTFVHEFSVKASPATLPVVGSIVEALQSTTKLPQNCRRITVCDATTIATETPTPSTTPTTTGPTTTPPATTAPTTTAPTTTPPATTAPTTTAPTSTPAATTPPATTAPTTTPPATTAPPTTPPTTTPPATTAPTTPPPSTTAPTTTQATTTAATTTEAAPAAASSSSITLTLVGNLKANILGIANIAVNIGISIDIDANIIALLNAETQVGVIINLKDNTGVYVTKKDNAIKKEGIKELLQSLSSLKGLLATKGATKFKVSSASNEILEVVNKILVSLILNLKAELKVHPKVGIQLIVALGVKWVKLLKGDLKGLPKTIGSSAITEKKDLIGLTNAVEAIGQLIGKLGGLSALDKAGVKIDLQKLLNAENGLDVLNILLVAIGTKLDVGKALGGLLNNPDSALKLLAQLGGNGNAGVSGLLKVVANTLKLSKKEIPLENVINTLIQFLGANKGEKGDEITKQVTKSINVLLATLGKIKAKDALKGLVDTLTKVRDQKLESNGINVSELLQKLLGGLSNPNLLEVLVSVLNLVVGVYALPVTLPILLVVLVLNADNPMGVSLLQGIGLVLNVVLGGVVSLVGGLLGSLLGSVTNLLSLLLGDLLGALGDLPVVGDLVKALEKALGGAGLGGELQKLLSDSEISDLLKGLLQVVTNKESGASEKAVEKIKEIQKNCGSVNSLLSINLDVNIGA